MMHWLLKYHTTAHIPHVTRALRSCRRCAASFYLIWFGVIMTIVMQMGLIHPPVRLDLLVIIPLRGVAWGTIPFVLLTLFPAVTVCFVLGIASAFSDLAMGPGH